MATTIGLAPHEPLLRLVPLLAGEAGVIDDGVAPQLPAEELGDRLAPLAARRVDDRRPRVLVERLAERGELVGLAAGLDGGVRQVRAVEPGDEHRRVVEVELVGDVAADEVGGRRGQGDARGRAEPLAGQADPRVIGAEVVPPLADAVRLVDRQQGRLDPRHHLDEPAAAEPLRGDVDEVVPPRLDLVNPRELLGRVERAVDQRGPDSPLRQGIDLVFHQGDERADDQGQAGQKERGQLVAEALAASGRHHAEDIALPQDLFDHLALTRPEPLQAEALAERLFQFGRAVGDAHGLWSLTPVGSSPIAIRN